jgi:oxygen-independent coproporphyrinogen-3 oxidase
VKIAQNAGFENLTIDLIYGTPTMSDERWLKNLEKAIALQTPHISSYCLTVEPKTLLEKQIKKQLLPNVSESQATNQFLLLMDTLENAGFEHYEISNFAQPDKHARHNSNYWLGKKYLGIGPSAHAYDGVSRQYNVANNSLYIKSLGENKIPFEKEILTDAQRYNEYVMTTLRTKWGSHTNEIRAFGDDFYQYFQSQIKGFLAEKQVSEQDGVFRLNKSGKLLADYITAELFWV